MKRLAAGLAVFIMAAVVLFAQSDYQVLALVKLNKNEPVMLKDLKSRVEIYEKQNTKDFVIMFGFCGSAQLRFKRICC